MQIWNSFTFVSCSCLPFKAFEHEMMCLIRLIICRTTAPTQKQYDVLCQDYRKDIEM